MASFPHKNVRLGVFCFGLLWCLVFLSPRYSWCRRNKLKALSAGTHVPDPAVLVCRISLLHMSPWHTPLAFNPSTFVKLHGKKEVTNVLGSLFCPFANRLGTQSCPNATITVIVFLLLF